jgi:hypothetical protein
MERPGGCPVESRIRRANKPKFDADVKLIRAKDYMAAEV